MIKYGVDLEEEKELEKEAELKKEEYRREAELKNKGWEDKDIPDSKNNADWFSRNAGMLHKDYGRIKIERKP